MTNARIRSLLVWTAVAAALGWAAREEMMVRREAKVLADAAQGRADLVQKVAAVEHQQEVASRSAAAQGAHAAEAKQSADRKRLAAVLARRLGPASLAALRARMTQVYGSFLASQKLSPEQVDQWLNGGAEYRQRMRDILVAAAQMGLTAQDPDVRAMMQGQFEKWNSTQNQILGPEVGAELKDFNRALPATTFVSQVAGGLFESEAPLTAAQGSQLAQILAAASSTYANGGPVMLPTVDWDTVYAKAAAVLSPTQLQALKGQVENLQVRANLSQRVNTLLNHP